MTRHFDLATLGVIAPVVLLAVGLPAAAQAQPALKDVFKDAFRIGAALNRSQFSEDNARESGLAKMHFNTITSEKRSQVGTGPPRAGRLCVRRA
jgi:hypothetical protein